MADPYPAAKDGLALPVYPGKGANKWDNGDARVLRKSAVALNSLNYRAAVMHKEEGNREVIDEAQKELRARPAHPQ